MGLILERTVLAQEGDLSPLARQLTPSALRENLVDSFFTASIVLLPTPLHTGKAAINPMAVGLLVWVTASALITP